MGSLATNRIRYLLVGVTTLAAMASAPTALGKDSSSRLPRLSEQDAKFYSRKALSRHFHAKWDYGYGKHLRCDKRKSRTKVRCRPVHWRLSDRYFHGWTTIWFKNAGNNGPYWYYAFRIVEVNEVCIHALHHSPAQCTKVHRVR